MSWGLSRPMLFLLGGGGVLLQALTSVPASGQVHAGSVEADGPRLDLQELQRPGH